MVTHAQWIVCPNMAPDSHADFYSPFRLKEGVFPVSLTLSADSAYAVWCNGQIAAFGQYANFPHHKVTGQIDLTPFRRTANEVRKAIRKTFCRDKTGLWSLFDKTETYSELGQAPAILSGAAEGREEEAAFHLTDGSPVPP